ncbi:MAG: hypothetical protein HDR47_01050 [Bacteroides sp.]|nr:hypothetical protein [Bacteroides sp.]
MKPIRQRNKLQTFLWMLRHPLLYRRAEVICQLRRKRIYREYLECMRNEYDPAHERWRRREFRKPRRIQTGITTYVEFPPDKYW